MLGKRRQYFLKTTYVVSIILVAVIIGVLLNSKVAEVDTFVELRMTHMELYESSAKIWPAYEASTEALRAAAAAQPDDGAPLSLELIEMIGRQKALLEKYAENAEAEFKEWEKFDVGHFEGEILQGRRRLNAYYSGVIRDSLQQAQKSAQLAFDDIPHGPNSAVLVKAAAQDFSNISSYQVEARAARERADAHEFR